MTRGCCGGRRRRSRRRVKGQRSARGLVSQRKGLSAIHQRCCASTYCNGTAAMTRRKEEQARTVSHSTIQTRRTERCERERERGEVSRLEGEGRAIASSLLHSSLERNWRVFKSKVVAFRPGKGIKMIWAILRWKGGTHNAFSTNLQNHKDNREGKILNQKAASMTSDVQLWNLISNSNMSVKKPMIWNRWQ